MFAVFRSALLWYLVVVSGYGHVKLLDDAEMKDCRIPNQSLRHYHSKLCQSVRIATVKDDRDAENQCQTINGAFSYSRSMRINSSKVHPKADEKRLLIGFGCKKPKLICKYVNENDKEIKFQTASQNCTFSEALDTAKPEFADCSRTIETYICLQYLLPKELQNKIENLDKGLCRQGFTKFASWGIGMCYTMQKSAMNTVDAGKRCAFLNGRLIISKKRAFMRNFAEKVLAKYLNVPVRFSEKTDDTKCYELSPPDYEYRYKKRKANSNCSGPMEGFICESSILPPRECRYTKQGAEYIGHEAETAEGLRCRLWTDQLPGTKHFTYVAAYFNGNNLEKQKNFCRNPQKNDLLWCYTQDSPVRRETCNVPLCQDCMYATNDYDGRIAIAKDKICDFWSNHPQIKRGEDDLNFCRSYGGRERPWCFTEGESWEYCDVPVCPDCRYSPRGQEYQGNVSKTENGKRCQRWEDDTPHKHAKLLNKLYPENETSRAENYCRNPNYDQKASRPWCYTVRPDTEWEYCDVPFCQGFEELWND